MANLVIGDKTSSPISSPATQNGGEQTRKAERQEARNMPEASGDRVALSSSGPSPNERPLSTRIDGPRQALELLQQLKTHMRQSPEQAMATHAGIHPGAAHALNSPVNGSA